jgi:hypothetical protein
MNPWNIQRLAQQHSDELSRAAVRAQALHEARARRRGGAPVIKHKATRYLGELLIRTGWRLIGPEGPASGARTRLVLRSTDGSLVDPC